MSTNTQNRECPWMYWGVEKPSSRSLGSMNIENSYRKETPWMLSVCGKTFSRSSSSQTPANSQKRKQPMCAVSRKSLFRKFQPTEQKTLWNKPYVRSICSNVFFRKFKLTEHQRTHTGEKPYEWTECAKPSEKGKHDTSAKPKRRKTHMCSERGRDFSRKLC